MTEENISEIHGPKEDTSRNNSYLSIKHMEKQNHEWERDRKM
jgi:hypothetical protein